MNEQYARRTIPFVFAAAVAAQLAVARPAATAPMSTDCRPFSSNVLRVYVVNEASASPQTLETAILETSTIWATAGLQLTWRLPPASLDLTDNRTVVLMIQRGLKRPPTIGAVPSTGPAPLLGRVPFGEDGPGRLIQVSFEAITSLVMGGSYMDMPIARLPELLQQVLLGRGLGRVIAHEIGHWLIGRGHMQEGLMRPAFSNRDLVEWNPPRLPHGWTGAGGRLPGSTRCEPTVRGD